MATKEARTQLKKLLTDTIPLLCKNCVSLEYLTSIDALIGVTLKNDDVILVSFKEFVQQEQSNDNEKTGEESACEQQGKEVDDNIALTDTVKIEPMDTVRDTYCYLSSDDDGGGGGVDDDDDDVDKAAGADNRNDTHDVVETRTNILTAACVELINDDTADSSSDRNMQNDIQAIVKEDLISPRNCAQAEVVDYSMKDAVVFNSSSIKMENCSSGANLLPSENVSHENQCTARYYTATNSAISKAIAGQSMLPSGRVTGLHRKWMTFSSHANRSLTNNFNIPVSATSLKAADELQQALAAHHSLTSGYNLQTNRPSEDASYNCYICSARLKGRQTLLDHIRGTHLEIYSYRCPTCGMSFKWRSTLKNHKAICQLNSADHVFGSIT